MGAPQVSDPDSFDEVPDAKDRAGVTISTMGKRASPLIDEASLTPVQRKRFAYFKQMRIFVTNLTHICERLRLKERSVRRYFLERDMKDLVIPPLVYLPVVSSTDTYATVLKALPKECHAFTTKARVPALLLFEVEAHPRRLDVATFLGAEMERYSESDVVLPKVALVNHTRSAIVEGDDDAESIESNPQVREPKPSKFADFRQATYEHWSAEGTGLNRLREAGYTVDSSASNNSSKKESSTQGNASVGVDNTSSPGPFGETFAQKVARLRGSSAYGDLPGWQVRGLIAKSNDDVRQEVFVMQLISYFKKAFTEANLPVYLHPYRIMSTSKSTGLIELVTDASSIDGLKKRPGFPGSLRKWYESTFGYNSSSSTQGESFSQAIENYIASMAGYSIVTYLLAIKDRHNGNIMIDTAGHVIHIDFGFVFGLAPGKQFSMEKAPWKLNRELAEVMGGPRSPDYDEYRNRCVQAFLVARKHARQICMLMEIMQFHSNYPCFKYNRNAIADFRARLHLDCPDSDIANITDRMLYRSYNNTGTDLYDSFQLATNGIAK
eukprot:scaffold2111_cov167-Ochromonas_danica.AAC.10